MCRQSSAVRPVKGQILALDNAAGLVRHVMFREDVYWSRDCPGNVSSARPSRTAVADREVTLEGLGVAPGEAFETVPGVSPVAASFAPGRG